VKAILGRVLSEGALGIFRGKNYFSPNFQARILLKNNLYFSNKTNGLYFSAISKTIFQDFCRGGVGDFAEVLIFLLSK
jgi:hypothetical protein